MTENVDTTPEVTELPDEASNISTSIISILACLSELRERRRDVIVRLEKLSAMGYGPCPWKFQIRESYSPRFHIVRPHPRAPALMARKPLITGTFSDVDSLHRHYQDALTFVVNETFVIYSEPASVAINGALVNDPEALGLPLSDMCTSELPGENVSAVVQPYCQAIRAQNLNYSDGFIAEGIDFSRLRATVHDIAREEMRPLRNGVIAYEDSLMNGRPDSTPYRVLHQNDLLNVIANPYNLNTMFNHLPLPVFYSSELVMEATMCELSVTPLSPSQMMINSAQSTSKLTVINTFSGINSRPEMDTTMGLFVSSLICPGSINFSVNLDDIQKEDIYLRALAALAAKILFSYSEDARWNSLCESSVRTVEAAIVRCGTAAGILETVPGANNVQFPLENVAPVARAQLDAFNMLRTAADGSGWRESGGMRFGLIPNACPYVDAQNRQLHVTPLDDLTGLDEEAINMEYALWHTRVAAHRFLACLARGRVQRTPMAGVECIFEVCAHRIFRFFIAMNHYNRENWYTSLRLSEARAANMFPNEMESPAIHEISGRTILYMLKSLDEKTIGRRVEPYLKQFALESAIMRDCVETLARERLFVEVNNRYGFQNRHFTRPERCEIIHPKAGPLCKILAHVRASGYTAQLGEFFEVANDLQITQLITDAIAILMANPLHFGISERVIIHPEFFRNRVPRLRDLADRGLPLTNEFHPHDPPEEVQDIRLETLQLLITNFSAIEELSEMSLRQPVVLHVPAPFSIATHGLGGNADFPIRVNYDNINRHNTVRRAVQFTPRTFIATVVDHDALRKPDIALASLPRSRDVHVLPDEFHACVEPLSTWLARIHIHMTPVRMLATKNVRIAEMFEK